jgi:contractile injection system tube protein/LysM domain-containing protein
MAATEKAFLEVVYGGPGGQKIPCMFNPETLSISRSNKWSRPTAPGKGIATAKYDGAEPAEMSLELWFDTTDTGKPVTDYTDKILGLLDLDKKVPGTNPKVNNARPPVVRFHWGQMVTFPAYIESVDVEYTYFSSAGVPLRANVSLELEQFREDELARQNPTSGTPHPHRVHRFMPGETLDRISAQYYGDATRWRALANANGIEDPLSIRPGSLLVIPEITAL